MLTSMMLLAVLTAQESSLSPRAGGRTEDSCADGYWSRALCDISPRLLETLDQSDVIVYVEPKLTRQALGGYLAHNIVTASGYRYFASQSTCMAPLDASYRSSRMNCSMRSRFHRIQRLAMPAVSNVSLAGWQSCLAALARRVRKLKLRKDVEATVDKEMKRGRTQ